MESEFFRPWLLYTAVAFLEFVRRLELFSLTVFCCAILKLHKLHHKNLWEPVSKNQNSLVFRDSHLQLTVIHPLLQKQSDRHWLLISIQSPGFPKSFPTLCNSELGCTWSGASSQSSRQGTHLTSRLSIQICWCIWYVDVCSRCGYKIITITYECASKWIPFWV